MAYGREDSPSSGRPQGSNLGTGARGPTGPQGQQRSNPGGNQASQSRSSHSSSPSSRGGGPVGGGMGGSPSNRGGGPVGGGERTGGGYQQSSNFGRPETSNYGRGDTPTSGRNYSNNARSPSIGFTNPAKGGAWTGNMRGPLGNLGELKRGITTDTRDYQNAELARTAYPNEIGAKYDQPTMTQFMNKLASGMPPEAYTAKYGAADTLAGIGRVGINQLLGGWSLKDVEDHIDSFGSSPRTKAAARKTQGLALPGTDLHTLSQDALTNALQFRGLPTAAVPNVADATNFVGRGGVIPGTKKLGTFKGTTYRSDDSFRTVQEANKRARDIMAGGVSTSPIAATPRVAAPPAQPDLRGMPVGMPRAKPVSPATRAATGAAFSAPRQAIPTSLARPASPTTAYSMPRAKPAMPAAFSGGPVLAGAPYGVPREKPISPATRYTTGIALSPIQRTAIPTSLAGGPLRTLGSLAPKSARKGGRKTARISGRAAVRSIYD